jgi:hypothetical protein
VSPDSLFSNPLLAPNNPLETLLLDLRLSCSDDCRRVRVAESTSRLAILVARCLSRAHAVAGRSHLRAASGATVGVGDAAAGDELRAVAGTDILGTRGVGGDLSEGGGCDWADVSALNG